MRCIFVLQAHRTFSSAHEQLTLNFVCGECCIGSRLRTPENVKKRNPLVYDEGIFIFAFLLLKKEFFNRNVAVKKEPKRVRAVNIFAGGSRPLKIGIVNFYAGYFLVSVYLEGDAAVSLC